MSFQQGLSGLSSASKTLEAIGNNVANANTVGFKQSQAIFTDVYAASLSGSGTSQIGIGTQLSEVVQQFTQGNVTASNNPLDMAINGGGFFRMSTNGTISYARNGQFQLDKSGYIVNSSGSRLTGYVADKALSADPEKWSAGFVVWRAADPLNSQFAWNGSDVKSVEDADPFRQAMNDLCQVLLNTNEFFYLH